jgi:hypothetical protein
MDIFDSRVLSTVSERSENELSITVNSETPLMDFRIFRDPMDDDGERRPTKKKLPTKVRVTVSTLKLVVTNGRLEMSRIVDDSPGGNLLPTDVIGYSDIFFQDEGANESIQEFLNEHFPNDFERTRTHKNLMTTWEQSDQDYIAMDNFFGTSAVKAENYPETLLMLVAYGFPVLFNRLPWDITSEDMFRIASDMTMAYCDFMSASTESELADQAFGSRRKFFRKLSPILTVNELSLIQQLSGIVSADILDSALRKVDFSEARVMVDCWYGNAEVLAKLSPTIQRHLVQDLFTHEADAYDAFNMVARYATDYSYFKGVKTIEQLHDKAVEIIPEITEDSRINNVDQSIRSAQEVFIPKISSKLELLINQKEFVRVGKELKICIGSASYFEKAIDGKAYCYKILENGALIGAIEVGRDDSGKWKSIQCRGERNGKLTAGDVIVEELLKKLEDTPETLSFVTAF